MENENPEIEDLFGMVGHVCESQDTEIFQGGRTRSGTRKA
jgi:hypothetical protein